MASIAPAAGTRANVVALQDLGPTEPVAATPGGEAALMVIRPAVARLLVLEPALRRGEDPEAVHDGRVAARRVRTALRLFSDVVPGWADGVRTELKWLSKTMGAVRDLDVQRRWLHWASEDIQGEDRAVLHAIDDGFLTRRAAAQEALIAALDSERNDRLRTDLTALARGPGVVTVEATRPIAVVAPPLVVRRYRAMQNAGKKAGPDASGAQLHALRIRAKRARYAVEFVAPLYGKPASSLAKRLRRLQDLLGDIHDAELAAQRMRTMAEHDDELPPNAGFVLGSLAERSVRRARKLRRRYPKTFEQVRGARWKDLKRAMLLVEQP